MVKVCVSGSITLLVDWLPGEALSKGLRLPETMAAL